jgi:hypothetical protein
MGLLSDALRHLLATDAGERRAGLAGLVGRMFGAEPVVVRHPKIPADLAVDFVHYPKSGGGLAPRGFAVTLSIGAAEDQGRELLAATLADARDPQDDRIAWLLASAREVQPGGVAELPAGCLGRSSHTHVIVTEPWVLSERDRPDYERIVGARLDLVVPITAREAEFVAARGVEAYVAAMREQGVQPYADRPAGETRLS